MKTNRLRDALVGGACLVGGVALAALISGNDAKPVSTSQVENPDATASVYGSSNSGATTTTGNEKQRASNAQEMEAFANSWTKLGGTEARLAAVVAWLNSFGAEDYVHFVNLLVAYDEADAAEMSESVEALTEWMFEDNESIGMLLFERWAKVAPESLVKMATSMEPELAGEIVSYAFPFLWAENPELTITAIAELKARGGKAFEDGFEEYIFAGQLYTVSEVAAVRWTIENGSDPTDVEYLFELGINDGKGVLAELTKIKNGDDREYSLQAFFESYIEYDADSAKSLLAGIEGKMEAEAFEELKEEVEFVWMLNDPAARMDFSTQPDLAEEVLGEWIAEDREAALAWATGAGKDLIEEDTFAALVAENRDSLPFDFLMEHGDVINTKIMPSEWTRSLSDKQLDKLIEKAPMHALNELYRRDPDRALTLAAAMPAGSFSEMFISQDVGGDRTRRDAWFDQLSEDRRRTGIIGTLFFSAWAEDDPAGAFAAAKASGSTTGEAAALRQWMHFDDVENIYAASSDRLAESEEMLNEVARAWAKRDPQTAGETFLADGLEAGVPALIGTWVLRDSVGASAFIRENLEPGATRDAAVSELVSGIAKIDPDGARQWADSISDNTARQETLKSLEKAD